MIDRSDPDLLMRAQAADVLRERTVQTTAVCLALDSAGSFDDLGARIMLGHLRGWIADHTGIQFARPSDWIDEMMIPQGHERMANELRIAAEVGDAFAMLWTAVSGPELESDRKRLAAALARWRFARARDFEPNGDDAVCAPWPRSATHLMYIVEHPALGVRRVGTTDRTCLDSWRRRGWDLIDTADLGDEQASTSAERIALDRLDRLGARTTPLMESLFENLSSDGRHEMYDRRMFGGGIGRLLGDALGEQLLDVEPQVPRWIARCACVDLVVVTD